MAYIGVANWEGDPQQLAKVFTDHLEPAAAAVAEKYGGLLSLHARTPSGIVTASVYETIEGSVAMHDDPLFRPAYEMLMELAPPTIAIRAELFGVRISNRVHELTTHESQPAA